MTFRLCDAHNHLQDERLAPHREAILAAVRREGVARMVVNGSSESDWPEVLALARDCPEVIPSFGYHPWHVKERSADWQSALDSGMLDLIRAGRVDEAEELLRACLWS